MRRLPDTSGMRINKAHPARGEVLCLYPNHVRANFICEAVSSNTGGGKTGAYDFASGPSPMMAMMLLNYNKVAKNLSPLSGEVVPFVSIRKKKTRKGESRQLANLISFPP